MDAHYDIQIRQQHQQSFTDQRDSLAPVEWVRLPCEMGVAMPFMKEYVLPVAQEFGKNLLSSFVPEFANIISGKKRPGKAVRDVLKHSANKTIAKANGNRGAATGAGAVAGAGGGPARETPRAGGRPGTPR